MREGKNYYFMYQKFLWTSKAHFLLLRITFLNEKKCIPVTWNLYKHLISVLNLIVSPFYRGIIRRGSIWPSEIFF